jgi:hypothetical protein
MCELLGMRRRKLRNKQCEQRQPWLTLQKGKPGRSNDICRRIFNRMANNAAYNAYTGGRALFN